MIFYEVWWLWLLFVCLYWYRFEYVRVFVFGFEDVGILWRLRLEFGLSGCKNCLKVEAWVRDIRFVSFLVVRIGFGCWYHLNSVWYLPFLSYSAMLPSPLLNWYIHCVVYLLLFLMQSCCLVCIFLNGFYWCRFASVGWVLRLSKFEVLVCYAEFSVCGQ